MRDNFFLVLAFLIFAFSVFGVGMTYYELRDYAGIMTGHATETGLVNLSVQTSVLIDFTSSTINWGVGSVGEGESFAYLDSWGNVVGGTWDAVSDGLVIKNEGNVNVSLNLSTGKNADSFIGGTSPSYKFNVTEVNDGACASHEDFNFRELYDNGEEYVVCENLVVNSSLRIDIALVIPDDSSTGTLSDVMTAEVSQV